MSRFSVFSGPVCGALGVGYAAGVGALGAKRGPQW